ncbi:MAG: hypothetical protein KC431_17530, partial [Myxococcales bacterium]|nr:hypothetical protein [Myxococcales bacterium]
MRATVIRSVSIGLLALAGLWGCNQTPAQRKRVRSDDQLEAERRAEREVAEREAAEREAAEAARRRAAMAVPSDPRIELANQPSAPDSPCQRTLCIAGPGALEDEPNRNLAELCRMAPGVVRLCEGEGEQRRCRSAWGPDEWRQGLEALILSMDRNDDGKVGEGDPFCSIHAAGWSQGAMIVGEELPKALRADERVAADRAVIERLVLIAPYAPERESVEISDAVHRAFIYRHSKAPADDCSRSFADGPWLSLRPHCSEATRCWDYDYSLEPELAFLGRQGSRSGGMLGHCNIVGVVAKVGAV